MASLQSVCSTGLPGELAVLVSQGKESWLVVTRNDTPVSAHRVIRGMTRVVSFPTTSGTAYLFSSRGGKTHVVRPNQRPKSLVIAGLRTNGIMTCGTTPVIVGGGTLVSLFNGTGWSSESDALASLASSPGTVRYAHSITSAHGDPIVGVFDGTFDQTVIARRTGGVWTTAAIIDGQVNALAFRESDGTIFAVGKGVWSVQFDGRVRRMSRAQKPEYWGAAVVGNRLLAASYTSCDAIDDDARYRQTAVPRSGARDDIAWTGHPLHVVDGRAVLVWKSKLWISDRSGRDWQVIHASALVPTASSVAA